MDCGTQLEWTRGEHVRSVVDQRHWIIQPRIIGSHQEASQAVLLHEDSQVYSSKIDLSTHHDWIWEQHHDEVRSEQPWEV